MSAPNNLNLAGLGAKVSHVTVTEAANVGGQVLRTLVSGKRSIIAGSTPAPIQEMRVYVPGFGIAIRDSKGDIVVVPFTNIEYYKLEEPVNEAAPEVIDDKGKTKGKKPVEAE